MKRFKKTAGFTLVELIVVIAIMAILAGVAVPTYNGYIKKAKSANDTQILAAVNNAFASACTENGVDVKDVDSATIAVTEQKVYGLSTFTDAESGVKAEQVAPFFTKYYLGNEDKVFETENVNSLVWNTENNSFEISAEYTSTLIQLSNGKFLEVSKDDMEAILNSTYADMSAADITELVKTLNKSATTLAKIVKAFKQDARIANVLVYEQLITSDAANKLNASEMANGLQMVTAKELARTNDIQGLLNLDLGTNALGLIKGLGTSGGTKTVSALALQYALVESYANSSYDTGNVIKYRATIDKFPFYEERTYNSASEFIADQSSNDPVAVISKIQEQEDYKTYAASEQFTKDVNGFVGTMSILGKHIGTISNPGVIDINQYFESGINSQDVQDALKGVYRK